MNHKNSNIPKIVLLSVINDLTADQRLHKVCTSLQKFGYSPILIGFGNITLKQEIKRNYPIRLISRFFQKGPLFYAEFNFKLFFYLLFTKADILVANDLDSLLANYLAYKTKKFFRKKVFLIYDSHELFTELPELNGRKITRGIWMLIEKMIVPRLKNAYTVCQPIADYYSEKYKIRMEVISNMPLCYQPNEKKLSINHSLPKDKKIILYQGALNIGRGIEQVIDIMEYIDNAVFLIIGTGTIDYELRLMVKDKKLENKVFFTGKIPFEMLNQVTCRSDIGLVLQEDISLSYRYVLPNRLFDFIKAGTPVLASALPEIKKIVESEQIGLIIQGFDRNILLEKLKILLYDESLISKLKENIAKCKSRYCWENEEEKLKALYLRLYH